MAGRWRWGVSVPRALFAVLALMGGRVVTTDG